MSLVSGLERAPSWRPGECWRFLKTELSFVSLGCRIIGFALRPKWRQLPLHPSTIAALRGYVDERERKFPGSKQPALFLSTRGTRLLADNASQVFAHLVRQSRMPVLDRHHQPHLHDLRHTFAVKTLQRWYRSGVDAGPMLPLVSRYLGHGDPDSTYWYLSATPELMGLVSDRVRSYLQEER